MKWLSIALEVAVVIYNHVTGKGKRDLAQELEIAQGMLKKLTSNLTPEQKGRLLVETAGSLKVVKNFGKRVSNKIDKAQERWARKLF